MPAACPNGHGTVEVRSTICEGGEIALHNLTCGCRLTGAQIQAGSAVATAIGKVGTVRTGRQPR